MAQKTSAMLEQVKDKVQGSLPESHEEGKLTKAIESQTARIPSVGYLSLALGSMVVSAALAFGSKETKRKELGTFIGLWAPTFLILGLYNKLVKVEGSDRTEKFGFGT